MFASSAASTPQVTEIERLYPHYMALCRAYPFVDAASLGRRSQLTSPQSTRSNLGDLVPLSMLEAAGQVVQYLLGGSAAPGASITNATIAASKTQEVRTVLEHLDPLLAYLVMDLDEAGIRAVSGPDREAALYRGALLYDGLNAVRMALALQYATELPAKELSEVMLNEEQVAQCLAHSQYRWQSGLFVGQRVQRFMLLAGGSSAAGSGGSSNNTMVANKQISGAQFALGLAWLGPVCQPISATCPPVGAAIDLIHQALAAQKDKSGRLFYGAISRRFNERYLGAGRVEMEPLLRLCDGGMGSLEPSTSSSSSSHQREVHHRLLVESDCCNESAATHNLIYTYDPVKREFVYSNLVRQKYRRRGKQLPGAVFDWEGPLRLFSHSSL